MACGNGSLEFHAEGSAGCSHQSLRHSKALKVSDKHRVLRSSKGKLPKRMKWARGRQEAGDDMTST